MSEVRPWIVDFKIDGCGQFSMEFSHYALCPKNVSDDAIAKAKAREEALRAGK